MTDKALVLSTAGSEKEARKIATGLVEKKLAACVNIVPRIVSVYRWQGRVESTEEFLLLIKTSKAREADVCSAIRELHSYELPECIAIPITSGSEEYLSWIQSAVDDGI
jgi:periplasmic divalent cation tolerance protein